MEHPIAVGILASYFVLIFALVWRTREQIHRALSNFSPGIALFIALTLVSFAATWTYMFKFFAYSYNEWKQATLFMQPLSLNSISLWLNDVSLFDSAWRQVCVGVWQWLWSHQLCSLTVSVWTPILAIEGTRRRIPYIWAYMLLGQVVAISVSSALFFAILLAYTQVPRKEPSLKLLNSLAISTVGGIITVVVSPFVASTSAFMFNLLVMHILLVLPLINMDSSSSDGSILPMLLYSVAAGANLVVYVNQWCECLATLVPLGKDTWYRALEQMWTTFFGHPAQSSISYDIVCMQVISVAWMVTYSKKEFHRVPSWVWLLMATTPIFTASVTLPLFYAGYEYNRFTNKKRE